MKGIVLPCLEILLPCKTDQYFHRQRFRYQWEHCHVECPHLFHAIVCHIQYNADGKGCCDHGAHDQEMDVRETSVRIQLVYYLHFKRGPSDDQEQLSRYHPVKKRRVIKRKAIYAAKQMTLLQLPAMRFSRGFRNS